MYSNHKITLPLLYILLNLSDSTLSDGHTPRPNIFSTHNFPRIAVGRKRILERKKLFLTDRKPFKDVNKNILRILLIKSVLNFNHDVLLYARATDRICDYDQAFRLLLTKAKYGHDFKLAYLAKRTGKLKEYRVVLQ